VFPGRIIPRGRGEGKYYKTFKTGNYDWCGRKLVVVASHFDPILIFGGTAGTYPNPNLGDPDGTTL
jgi:hypothetical protein